MGPTAASRERATNPPPVTSYSGFSAVDSHPAPTGTISVGCLLYISRETKSLIFRGTSGIAVKDWVGEIKATLRTQNLKPVDIWREKLKIRLGIHQEQRGKIEKRFLQFWKS